MFLIQNVYSYRIIPGTRYAASVVPRNVTWPLRCLLCLLCFVTMQFIYCCVRRTLQFNDQRAIVSLGLKNRDGHLIVCWMSTHSFRLTTSYTHQVKLLVRGARTRPASTCLGPRSMYEYNGIGTLVHGTTRTCPTHVYTPGHPYITTATHRF